MPFCGLVSQNLYLLAQFSLYVHKSGLKPDSFHFISFPKTYMGRIPQAISVKNKQKSSLNFLLRAGLADTPAAADNAKVNTINIPIVPGMSSTENTFEKKSPSVVYWRSEMNGKRRKHATSSRCWINVGPPSTTLAQHWTNNGSMSLFAGLGEANQDFVPQR